MKIYTPDSELIHPYRLVRSMFRDLIDSRELAWRLFVRNVSAQYRQSLLGYFWAFAPPLATTAVWVFLSSQRVINVSDTVVPYAAFVMIGTLLWQTFVDALNMPIRMVVSSKAMLTKINFPREALILAGIAEVIFNFLVRFVLVIATILWFQLSIRATMLFVPLGVLTLIGLGTVGGVILSPLGALYADVEKGMLIATSFLFFLTPIAYGAPKQGLGALAMKINPVSSILITTRDWIIGGPAEELQTFFLVVGVTIFLLGVGWLLYRISMPHLIARMGG